MPSGRSVTVGLILFDHPRAWCQDLGINQGDHVTIGHQEGESVLVKNSNGELVRCPAEVARFVVVERCG
jgi:formylmethanofuran dehydrogenase subunit D